ncbi:MAG: carbohydrate ABC transporter permease [Rhodospirillaceae bacterium]|jgi:multiple sugar transport system permease protein|nr:carbohydrate ABC transporter permease [Rhodospirillaceae bacterium]MBT4427010.1 carbohydrate ABC transporter permease [Rhodospirillaceae bacterium]MBT5036907.1 carbohydrate ABC transporter permease [Rhodospirillaceae bacterium]MBT5675918.1 carbohydrate ABC transporter permease [Rhodospirillaceae bacterium]MBT5780093.1 carbohydrate ABC transporter permease [Rhodospirillaceae bacterium]
MPERKFTPFNFIALIAGLLFAVFPILWMVSTSFKLRSEWVTSPPTWISSAPTVDNYLTILAPHILLERRGGTQQVGDEDFGGSKDDAAGGAIADFLNRSAWPGIKGSIIISISATILSIVVGLMAAISISRYRFGGNFTPFFILAGRMFPPIAIAIPFVIMFGPKVFDITDTYIGLILAYAAVTVPFSTWMLKSFVDDLPHEIEEAAMMDGYSRWRAHFTVTVPLIKGGIIATTLFIFILNWSEFLFALILTYTNVQTIPVTLSKYFSATEGTLYGVQAALAMVSIVPLVTVGFFIQKHLVRGLTLGAIKR